MTVVEATLNHHVHHSKEDLITKTGGMDDSWYPTMVEDNIHSSYKKKPTSAFNISRQTTGNRNYKEESTNLIIKKLRVTVNMNIKITIEEIPQVQLDCKLSITVHKGRCVHITWAPTRNESQHQHYPSVVPHFH